MISNSATHNNTWGGREDEQGNYERDRDDDDGGSSEAPEARDRDSATSTTFGSHRGCGHNGDRALGTLTSSSVSFSDSSSHHYYHHHQQQQQHRQQQQQRSSHAPSTPSSWISPYHYDACFAPQQQQQQQGLMHLQYKPVQLPQRSQFRNVTTVPMTHPYRYDESRFTLEDAMRMMLRTDDSKLRTISIDHMHYTVSFRCYP